MLDALAKGVLDMTKKDYKKKSRVEGKSQEGWLVMDFGDVVVHLFSPTNASITTWKNCGATGRYC